MELELINTLRQRITAQMPVINYDKPTINQAIEDVYEALKSNGSAPSLSGFSAAQKTVINTVVGAQVQVENAANNAPQELWVESVKLKIILHRLGLLNTINSLVEQTNGETQIWWEYGATFNMYDAKVQAMKAAANMTDQELLEIFTAAQ